MSVIRRRRVLLSCSLVAVALLASSTAPVDADNRALVVAVDAGSGPNTAVAQARLTELGFWTGVSNGLYGFTTFQAVMAFQKYAGLPPTGRIDQETADRLNAQSERAHGESQSRTWIEVDKKKQLLFIVVEGHTLWTFNTSTGSEVTNSVAGRAVTPDGLWTVGRERPNGWWRSDLGEIYRPKYFRGAVAIHGMNSVPNRPASHGCVRLSTAAMDFIWDNDLMPIGTRVWVHE